MLCAQVGYKLYAPKTVKGSLGNSESSYGVALEYYSNGDYNKAFEWAFTSMKQSEGNESIKPILLLSRMVKDNVYVSPIDEDNYNLAKMFAEFATNAEEPDLLSYGDLSLYEGIDTQDLSKAEAYLVKGIQQKNVDLELALIASKLKSGTEDKAQAIGVLKFYADALIPEAQADLANLYIEGKYIPQNIQNGERVLNELVQANNAYATTILATHYFSGKYLTKDQDKAKQLLDVELAGKELRNFYLLEKYSKAFPKDESSNDFYQMLKWYFEQR